MSGHPDPPRTRAEALEPRLPPIRGAEAMTTLGLLAKPLSDAEVVNRRHPAPSLLGSVAGWLRGVGEALLEIAEAMLRPEVDR